MPTIDGREIADLKPDDKIQINGTWHHLGSVVIVYAPDGSIERATAYSKNHWTWLTLVD